MATQIVERIHARASLAGCSDILLLSNSIKSLLISSSPSQVSTSHVSTTPVQLAKNIITNASFRAKKMPTDRDIPNIQVDASALEESGSSPITKTALNSMAAIDEEVDGGGGGVGQHPKDSEEKTPSKSESKGLTRDKLIGKFRKKTLSEDHVLGMSDTKSKTSIDKKEKKEPKVDKKKAKERPDKLDMPNEGTPLVSNLNGDSTSAASNSSKEYDSVEKVEELIQMKRLPPETITIHSPESGTTIF